MKPVTATAMVLAPTAWTMRRNSSRGVLPCVAGAVANVSGPGVRLVVHDLAQASRKPLLREAVGMRFECAPVPIAGEQTPDAEGDVDRAGLIEEAPGGILDHRVEIAGLP